MKRLEKVNKKVNKKKLDKYQGPRQRAAYSQEPTPCSSSHFGEALISRCHFLRNRFLQFLFTLKLILVPLFHRLERLSDDVV